MKRIILSLFLCSIMVGVQAQTQAQAQAPGIKPIPAFALPQLTDASLSFSPQSLKGQVWLLNVWASWCTSCRKEHALLLDLAKQGVAPLIGFNYQDQREAGRAWLDQHGDPYQLTAFDADGRAGMALGVIGLPETFVIDQQGRIRFRHAGPITPDVLKNKLLPLIKELSRS